MGRLTRKVLILIATLSLFSCFNITVNVYFPAKDVKSAFKSLEKDLMKGEAPEGDTGQTPPAPAAPAAPAPPKDGGSSWLMFGPTPAYAQGAGEFTSALAGKLRDDPAVVAAYKEMGARLGYINTLRDQGRAGEGGDGLLKPRGDLGKKESLAVDEENANRRAIIRAMAKALVELNNQPVNDNTVGQVLDKAAGQFAAVRAEAAKPGWWVQKSDGSWSQK